MDNNKLRALQKEYDANFAAVRQRLAREGKPVVLTCRRGCSACCSEPVYVGPEEVELLVESIPPAEMPGVIQRVNEWLAKMLPSGLVDPEVNGMANLAQYRAMRAPCPLLKNGECLVYQQRPIGCRSHSAKGPREFCENDALRPRQVFGHSPELVEGFLRNYVALGGSPTYHHLGVLLADALDKRAQS